MAWVWLLLAGSMEVAFALSLDRAKAWNDVGWLIAAVAALLVSVALLSLSLRSLPLPVAYALWTSLGAIGTMAVSVALREHVLSASQVAAVVMIASGTALLYLGKEAGS